MTFFANNTKQIPLIKSYGGSGWRFRCGLRLFIGLQGYLTFPHSPKLNVPAAMSGRQRQRGKPRQTRHSFRPARLSLWPLLCGYLTRIFSQVVTLQRFDWLPPTVCTSMVQKSRLDSELSPSSLPAWQEPWLTIARDGNP